MSKSNIYLTAAERFYTDYIEDTENGHSIGTCSTLLRIGATHEQIEKYQELFDCSNVKGPNWFDIKLNKLNKKRKFRFLTRKQARELNEIRVLALLFASHALDS